MNIEDRGDTTPSMEEETRPNLPPGRLVWLKPPHCLCGHHGFESRPGGHTFRKRGGGTFAGILCALSPCGDGPNTRRNRRTRRLAIWRERGGREAR